MVRVQRMRKRLQISSDEHLVKSMPRRPPNHYRAGNYVFAQVADPNLCPIDFFDGADRRRWEHLKVCWLQTFLEVCFPHLQLSFWLHSSWRPSRWLNASSHVSWSIPKSYDDYFQIVLGAFQASLGAITIKKTLWQTWCFSLRPA